MEKWQNELTFAFCSPIIQNKNPDEKEVRGRIYGEHNSIKIRH